MPTIFHISPDGNIRPMTEGPYESEALLQSLLERFPEVLASTNSGRWLHISRELGVPDSEDSGGRWFLDHLFVDQFGVPTLVEVKRSSDTRVRREVVAQMLDYAANAVVHWPIETIRTRFEEGLSEDPDSAIADFIGQEPGNADGVDAFWESVEANLSAGRIRMVFVADKIPPELRRIVEFLNGQMNPAEVIAVEVRQYEGGGGRTLVPRVIGQTAASEAAKGRRPREQWNEESFFAAMDEEQRPVARDLYDWIKERVDRIWWGEGSLKGSCVPICQVGKNKVHVFALWTDGSVEIYFQYLANKPPFDQPEMREELRRRLNQIEGVSLPEDSISRRPWFKVSLLASQEARRQFKETVEWAFQAARDASQ